LIKRTTTAVVAVARGVTPGDAREGRARRARRRRTPGRRARGGDERDGVRGGIRRRGVCDDDGVDARWRRVLYTGSHTTAMAW
jgi:hypothetical protein